VVFMLSPIDLHQHRPEASVSYSIPVPCGFSWTCGILPHGGVPTSHKAMVSSHWRRRLQWRQAQERSYAPVGQQRPNQAAVRTRHETRPVKHQQYSACRTRGLLCVQCGYRDNSVQCKPTSKLLMVWGRYPPIDTSPINLSNGIFQRKVQK
jgi:hypothetical protein